MPQAVLGQRSCSYVVCGDNESANGGVIEEIDDGKFERDGFVLRVPQESDLDGDRIGGGRSQLSELERFGECRMISTIDELCEWPVLDQFRVMPQEPREGP